MPVVRPSKHVFGTGKTLNLDCAGKRLDLSQPCVMGIINVTPDSFSDGGRYLEPAAALDRAYRVVEDGAAIIDVGGESTRPGAHAVSEDEELRRVIPIIEALAGTFSVPISVDTSKPRVLREAVAAGAGFINDVMALRVPGALEAAVDAAVPVCLMHMRGQPRTMQRDPEYQDVLREVRQFLLDRVEICTAAGIPRNRLLLDPGIGFGKTLHHNLVLLKNLDLFADMGLPLLVGISRKSMIGALLGNAPVDQRLAGSLAAAVISVERGASIIRAHDVKATVDALRVAVAVLGKEESV